MRFKDFIKKYFIHKREPIDVFEPLMPTEVRRFVIPVNGLSRKQAEEQIKQLMSDYHEEVDWNEKIDLKYDQKKYDFHRTPYIPDNIHDYYCKCGPHHPKKIFKIPIGTDFWFPTDKQKKMMDEARLIWNISQ